MSHRLQVLLSESDRQHIQLAAKTAGVSVGEWVRQAIHKALGEAPEQKIETKLLAVREAVSFYGPTGDIEQMNREIEQGYESDLY